MNLTPAFILFGTLLLIPLILFITFQIIFGKKVYKWIKEKTNLAILVCSIIFEVIFAIVSLGMAYIGGMMILAVLVNV